MEARRRRGALVAMSVAVRFRAQIVANHFNCARSTLLPLMASSVSDTAASGWVIPDGKATSDFSHHPHRLLAANRSVRAADTWDHIDRDCFPCLKEPRVPSLLIILEKVV